MKKVVLILAIIFAMGAKAQVTPQQIEEGTQSSLTINEEVDEFTGKVSYNVSEMCVFDAVGKRQFMLMPYFSDKGKPQYLAAGVVGIGCMDNTTIYIMLEDGEVITKTMFNKFNCDGLAAFRMTNKDWDKLATQRITKVKIYNKGKDVVSEPENSEYFITVINLVENNQFKTE